MTFLEGVLPFLRRFRPHSPRENGIFRGENEKKVIYPAFFFGQRPGNVKHLGHWERSYENLTKEFTMAKAAKKATKKVAKKKAGRKAKK